MKPQPQINLFSELIVDNFAGGGGASTGIELATGRPVDIAINHDCDAILMHKTNHPYTKHYQANVWDIDPIEVCHGQKVGLAWFSPDCKHFSKAKGGKPVEKSIRGLAWIVLRWAGKVHPRVIILENVEEFQTWGPLKKGRPVKSKSGQTFHQWESQLRSLGYEIEHRELKACDYGAPTIRKRFFLIARCDSKPIVESLKTFIAECPALEEFATINVDELEANGPNYSIDSMPGARTLETDLAGNKTREYPFTLSSRKAAVDNLARIENNGFYEHFADWLEEQTDDDNLPDLGTNRIAESIEATSWGYLFGRDENDQTAIYQIICKLTYTQMKG